jgi:hypothetical protein
VVDICALAMSTRSDLPIPPTGGADAKVPLVEGTAGNTTPEHHSVPSSIVDENHERREQNSVFSLWAAS